MSGLEAIFLLGSAHSVILAVALLRRGHNRRANRYLAALLGAVALLLADRFLGAGGAFERHPHLIGLTAWVPFWVGPLVFLYVREMTAPEPSRLPPPWRHFAASAAFLAVLAVAFYPRSADYKLAIAEGTPPWYVAASELAVVLQGLAYASAALVLLHRHRIKVQELYSSLRGITLRWLAVLVGLNALVWLAALVVFLFRPSGDIVAIGSTVTVFVVGYFQLGQAPIYQQPAAAPARPAPTYQRARLADDDAAELEARIRAAMTEKRLHRRAGLTLADLADEVAATPHELSQVLSTRLGRNFYTFVNEHRIEEVKAALAAGDRPVLDLALEAGFQSKSTFNAAFRKATGMTPREYRQRATGENRSSRTS